MPFSSLDSSFPEEIWTMLFNELSQRIRQYFVRPESHQRALAYIQGLMSEASRKNGWQVAEEVGETNPYAIQHLLDRAKWDCDGVRDELRAYILERPAASNAVVVIDETGFRFIRCLEIRTSTENAGKLNAAIIPLLPIVL